MCSHGHKRKYNSSEIRPIQRVNYTGCKAGFNLNEQADGSWKIGVKLVLDHNHELSREEFTGMRVGNKVTVKELELVELLSTAKAPPRKIAEVVVSILKQKM